jgi:hypothetical protein
MSTSENDKFVKVGRPEENKHYLSNSFVYARGSVLDPESKGL